MKYRFYGTITVSVSTVVEADTFTKANEIAESRRVERVTTDRRNKLDELWLISGQLEGQIQIESGHDQD